MKIFTVGEILTAPILNDTMWSFSTYKASTSEITLGTGGTIVTNYCRPGHGQLTFFNGYITFGTSPAITATCTVTLPTNVDTRDYDYIEQIQWCQGNWIFRDVSLTNHHSGTLGVWNASGTEFSFGGAWNGTIPGKRITTGVPFTVAADDRLSWQGYYISL